MEDIASAVVVFNISFVSVDGQFIASAIGVGGQKILTIPVS